MIGEFIDGPLWYFSLGVFCLGVLFRLFAILRAGLKPDLAMPRTGEVLEQCVTCSAGLFPGGMWPPVGG